MCLFETKHSMEIGIPYKSTVNGSNAKDHWSNFSQTTSDSVSKMFLLQGNVTYNFFHLV